MPSEVLKKSLLTPDDCAATTDADTMHRRTAASFIVVFLFMVCIRLKALILRMIPLSRIATGKPCGTSTFSRDTVPRFRTYRASSLLPRNRLVACARAFLPVLENVRRRPEDRYKARALRKSWSPRAEEFA